MKHQIMGILAASALVSHLSAQSVDTVVTNLSEPFAVVADGTGIIYISDAANNRIEKFNVTTSVKTTLAGSATQPAGSANGTGSLARFYYPQGLVLARGGLVVADSGNNLIRFVGFNGVVSNLAGQAGAYDFADGSGAAARFANPLGLASDSAGNIYIADLGNNRIRKLATNNSVTTIVSGGLLQPSGVAIGENGDIWVADTRHHVIKRFNAGGALTLVAGLSGTSGAADSDFASGARFTLPQGVLWLGGSTGLLISDSGNHTVRRLYTNASVGDFSVETVAGTPGQAGFVNGTPGAAKFSSPIGLTRDPVNGGFMIVDRANNAVRRLITTAPLPPISKPVVGIVTFPPPDELSVLVPTENAVFNNDVIIAVLPESGTETFFTSGPTPASSFEDTIPVPSALTGNSVPPYYNGQFKTTVRPTLLPPQPDVTVKIISTQDGRQSSPVTQARFQFKTANPSIEGDNAASFALTDLTAGAEIWYTLDGSDPTNSPAANGASVGPMTSGARLSILITTNTTLRARAFRSGYRASEIASKEFSPQNFQANRLSFGFESGEGSSDFVASAGQKFYAPVTLSIIPNQTLYSLQFNVTVTNRNGAPGVAPGAVGFKSMLEEYDDLKKVYKIIPPSMVSGYTAYSITNVVNGTTNITTTNAAVYQSLVFNDARQNDNLLGVGWLARSGLDPKVFPNLFDVTKQDLITFSQAKDTIFQKANLKIMLGGYSFNVPPNAGLSDQYTIKLDRPSGTSDGYGAPGSAVAIQTPTNGAPAGGLISGQKTVTVGQRRYTVGDVYPFRWLNAGDFGDTNLVSADVAQVFQTAVYNLNSAVAGSDMEDAMDSCCGTGVDAGGYFVPSAQGDSTDFANGNDLLINTFAFGDGVLDVRDVFVTFRRSLDPSLTWYQRYWRNGGRVAEMSQNVFQSRPAASKGPQAPGSTTPPLVNFTVGDILAGPGQTATVPITADVFGDYPVRVLQFSVTVEPADGSPALTSPVQFLAGGLGQPALTTSTGPDNYAAAWLNSAVPGISGRATIGSLQVKIPTNATAVSAYRIALNQVSVSPNGVALLPRQIRNGLVTLASRTNSSWGDGIPDSWRLRYFGSVANALSQATADADGDKVSNLAEYKMGTDPNDVASLLHLMKPKTAAGLAVRWPTVAAKHYVVESSPALSGSAWSVLSANLVGDGQEMEFTDSTPGPETRFYRVRVTDE